MFMVSTDIVSFVNSANIDLGNVSSTGESYGFLGERLHLHVICVQIVEGEGGHMA